MTNMPMERLSTPAHWITRRNEAMHMAHLLVRAGKPDGAAWWVRRARRCNHIALGLAPLVRNMLVVTSEGVKEGALYV